MFSPVVFICFLGPNQTLRGKSLGGRWVRCALWWPPSLGSLVRALGGGQNRNLFDSLGFPRAGPVLPPGTSSRGLISKALQSAAKLTVPWPHTLVGNGGFFSARTQELSTLLFKVLGTPLSQWHVTPPPRGSASSLNSPLVGDCASW